ALLLAAPAQGGYCLSPFLRFRRAPLVDHLSRAEAVIARAQLSAFIAQPLALRGWETRPTSDTSTPFGAPGTQDNLRGAVSLSFVLTGRSVARQPPAERHPD